MTDTDKSKFALCLLALAAGTALLMIGRIDGAQWVSVTSWVVAAYVLGQVAGIFATGYTTNAVKTSVAQMQVMQAQAKVG